MEHPFAEVSQLKFDELGTFSGLPTFEEVLEELIEVFVEREDFLEEGGLGVEVLLEGRVVVDGADELLAGFEHFVLELFEVFVEKEEEVREERFRRRLFLQRQPVHFDFELLVQGDRH